MDNVREMFQTVLEFLDDEKGGERDTLTTLLMLALIILPLLTVIIFFGNDILEYADQKWQQVKGAPVNEK